MTASLIVEKDGTLLEFIGYEVMAIWNAPISQEDHIFRAVRQALEIVLAFRKLAQAPRKAKHLLGGEKFPEVCWFYMTMIVKKKIRSYHIS